jgi:hypothetical protein
LERFMCLWGIGSAHLLPTLKIPSLSILTYIKWLTICI